MQTFVTNNGPNRPSVVKEHVFYGRCSFELMLYSITCYIHYNAMLMSETVYRQKCFANAKQSVFNSCYSSHVSAYAIGRGLQPVFPLRKYYTEQVFVLLRTKRMQLRNHADTQTVKRPQRLKGCAVYMYRIKFRMLEVRENEIALRKLSGGTAQLRSCAP